MYKSLSCVVKSSVSTDQYDQLFGQVCGYSGSPCAGITHNATLGTYGAYGMCNSTEQLAFAFNQYASGQKNNPSACGFGGAATTQATASAVSSCASLMSQAGSAGTGTVTASPTAGGTAAGASGSSTASKTGAASAVTIPSVQFGLLSMGAYVVMAIGAGMGMVLL